MTDAETNPSEFAKQSPAQEAEDVTPTAPSPMQTETGSNPTPTTNDVPAAEDSEATALASPPDGRPTSSTQLESIQNSPQEQAMGILPDTIVDTGEVLNESAKPTTTSATPTNSSPQSGAGKNLIHSTPSRSADARSKSLRVRQSKRDAKLARIVEFARNRGAVRNDDIKRILRVSDATATRYARLLVQRGELMQHGKGRGVRYTTRF